MKILLFLLIGYLGMTYVSMSAYLTYNKCKKPYLIDWFDYFFLLTLAPISFIIYFVFGYTLEDEDY